MTKPSTSSKRRALALMGACGAATILAAATNGNFTQSASRLISSHSRAGFLQNRIGRSLFADIPGSNSRRLSLLGHGDGGGGGDLRKRGKSTLGAIGANDLIREKLRKALYMMDDFASSKTTSSGATAAASSTTLAEIMPSVAAPMTKQSDRKLYSARDEQEAADQDYNTQLSDVGASLPDLALSPVLSQNLANVNEPSNVRATPLFWHIPKAGGTSIKYMYSACYGLVEASRVGGHMADPNADIENEPLSIFEPWPGRKFVNVDTTSLSDLERARRLNFASSGLADVIFFHANFMETVQMFTPDYPGRMFAMFRHPVERVNSLFHYLQDATWERTYSPETKGWSVQQYVESLGPGAHDWMTRFLVGKVNQPLDEYDLELAKLILKEKVLVGLTNRAEESQMRFDAYFGFDAEEPTVRQCVDDLNEQGGTNKHSHAKIRPGSEEWAALASVNRFDIPLYVYATQLFEEQGNLFRMHLERVN